jgi:hypothetical protein
VSALAIGRTERDREHKVWFLKEGERMESRANANRAVTRPKSTWVRYALIVLIVEKIIQHIAVTLAFCFNWRGIASTVAVSSDALMILGAIVALLFMLSLWGMITQKKWAVNLVIGLAVFDFVGEFVAQGTLYIVITVSILVATILLTLGLVHRRGEAKAV